MGDIGGGKKEGEIKSRWISLREVETPGIVGEREGKRGGIACGAVHGCLMGDGGNIGLEVGK